MQRSVPYHARPRSLSWRFLFQHARFGSLSCKVLFHHVKVRSLACYHPFLNMVAPDPTSHGTNVSMTSSALLHVVIGSCLSWSGPCHADWSSHKFCKVYLGSHKEHEQGRNTDTIFRIHVSIFRIRVSIFRYMFPIRSPDDVIFCLGEFWDSDQGDVDCVVKVGCGTSWRIRKWISPLRQLFGDSNDLKDQSDNFSDLKGNKSDEDEIQIQFQFQF